MARKGNRIITKADYTLSNRHALTPKGVIFEHDHATIQQLEDDEQTFSESNFRFKIRPGGNPRKRHTRGKWAEWVSNGESGSKWTLDTVDDTVSAEAKIVMKPDYSSLRDFACYGSAIDLVKASINDIVLNFPGSIILTDKPVNVGTDENGVTVISPIYDITDGKTYTNKLYEVSNETLVDVDTPYNVTLDASQNKLKFLQISASEYVDGDGNPISVETKASADGAWCDGTVVAHVMIGSNTVLVYFRDGKKYLLSEEPGTTVLARINEKRLNEYFDSLDDFERVLLDRSSTPIYSAKFETPYADSYGYHYRVETYRFPTVGDGFTPDLSSSAYSMYLERLIKLADFHDNYDADNIWRMMTHEAVKNLDWTFVRDKDGEPDDASDIDTTRFEMVLKLYGRQYDDILRMVEGIKSTNRITYDEKNNAPDYVLSDQNEIGGWELTNVSPTTDNSVGVHVGVKNGVDEDGNEVEYRAKYYREYNGVDANTGFLRRLKLNSNYINSMKGTKRGIEALLGLFGMMSEERAKKLEETNPDIKYTADYSLTEYIRTASGKPSYDDIVRYNARKDVETGDGIDIDPLSGLPLALTSEGNVIPWYNSKMEYDGGLYYQMNGGWGRMPSKKISLGITEVEELKENEDFRIYSETLPYLKFAESVSVMLEFKYSDVKSGDVCYVTNISDLSEYKIGDKDTVNADFSNASHYFILNSREHSTTLGYDDESTCYGWRIIANDEFDGKSAPTDDGMRVLYLESLKSDEKGNNPHCGYGDYDDGEEYIERLAQPFKYALDNNWFSSLDNKDKTIVKNLKFAIGNDTEDKKIEFFKDESETRTLVSKKVAKDNDSGQAAEDGFDKSEQDADMIVNVKTFDLKFNEIGGDEQFRNDRYDYITNVVIPFVAQVIPSTAIFRYRIGDTEGAAISRGRNVGGATKAQNTEVAPMEKVESNTVKPMSTVNFFENDFGGII